MSKKMLLLPSIQLYRIQIDIEIKILEDWHLKIDYIDNNSNVTMLKFYGENP